MRIEDGLALEPFLLTPLALQRRLLRHLCIIQSAPIRFERIEAFLNGLDSGLRREQLPKGFVLESKSGLIRIVRVEKDHE